MQRAVTATGSGGFAKAPEPFSRGLEPQPCPFDSLAAAPQTALETRMLQAQRAAHARAAAQRGEEPRRTGITGYPEGQWPPVLSERDKVERDWREAKEIIRLRQNAFNEHAKGRLSAAEELWEKAEALEDKHPDRQWPSEERGPPRPLTGWEGFTPPPSSLAETILRETKGKGKGKKGKGRQEPEGRGAQEQLLGPTNVGLSPAPELDTRLPYVQVAWTHRTWVLKGQALVWLPREKTYTHRRLAILYDAPTVVGGIAEGRLLQ